MPSRREKTFEEVTAFNSDFDEPIEPMVLGNMHELGVRRLAVQGA